MRNVIEKFQRLSQIREKYAEQIEAFADKQLAVHKKLMTEFKVDGYERDNMQYDFLKVGENGEVELWERGRCGDGDSWSNSINIHELVLKNDLEGYEQHLRAKYEAKAQEVIKAKEKEKQARRARLQADLARINTELGALS